MFRVEWKNSALDELTALWLAADSEARKAITEASHEIDQRLRGDPESQGESRPDGRRIFFVPPLGCDTESTRNILLLACCKYGGFEGPFAVCLSAACWSQPTVTEYENAREKAALFDVSDRGKIEVAGPDAARFLHNLCTNDILSLPVGSGREAFLCTVKARVVSPLLVYRAPESFWLDTGPGTGAKVFKHLDRHLISEQVELTDRTGDFAQYHLAGPEARAVLTRAAAGPVPELAGLPHVPLEVAGTASFVRRHDPLALPGYDVLCPREQGPTVRQALVEAGASASGAETYNLLRVEAGTPLYGVDIDDERFVVEVGRSQQAISYTKGCYLGQEPIVMARDRGHVNRTFVGIKLGGSAVVAPGTKLLRDGAEVGHVTSSVVSPRFGPIALAYLRRGSWDPGIAVQVEGDGRNAEVVGLPFA